MHTFTRGARKFRLNELTSAIGGIDPTSLGPMLLWLKPDVGISNLTAGVAVSSWQSHPGTSISVLSQAVGIQQPVVTYLYFGGKPGVFFDGTDDYLGLAGGTTLTAPFSVTVLYNSGRLAPTGQLITGANGGNWQWRVSNVVFAYANSVGITSAAFNNPTSGVTKMLTGVYNGATMNFYDSLTNLGPGGAFASYYWDALGKQWGSEGTWFQGAIAEVLIYNAALSVAQLKTLHDDYFKVKYSADASFV